jgi:hypothetical protein
MESREIELYSKLYKTEKRTTHIFGVFELKHKNKRNCKQSKIFLDFSEYQTENRRQSKPKLEN